MSKPRGEIPVMEPLEDFETWLLIWTAANLGSLREVTTLAFGCACGLTS